MAKTVSKPLEMAALPHNGTPEYRQPVEYTDGTTGKRVNLMLGGQRLLIFLAVYVYKRFIAPVGRRFGKTTSVPFLVMEESRITKGKYYCLFIAQDHGKAMEMLELCIETWSGIYDPKTNPGGMVTRKVGGPNDQRRYLEVLPFDLKGHPKINTGIRVYFVSGAHPHYKRIRGYTHHMNRVICDEYAQIHPLLRKVVMPMLADCGGRFLAIGTTDEEEIGNDQFHTYYQRGLSEEPEYANWGAVNFPSMANPHLNEEGLNEVINDCIDDNELQQEVYAKFLKGKGAVFSNLNAVLCLPATICNDDTDAWPTWVNEAQARAIEALGKSDDDSKSLPNVWIYKDVNHRHSYVMGVDWAKTNDHTVISVFDMTTLEQVAVIRFHGDNYTAQLEFVKSVKDYYDVDALHGDEQGSAGMAMGDFLRAEYETGVIKDGWTQATKGGYVRRGQVIFFQGRVKMIKCKPQVKEFKTFRKILPNTDIGATVVRYTHVVGGHDDFVDSFLMITEAIVDGQIAAEEEVKKKKYNMIGPNNEVDHSYWDDNPCDEALEDWEEEMVG